MARPGLPRFRYSEGGWRPLDRASLVAMLMAEYMAGDWQDANDVRRLIEANVRFRALWDELPSHYLWEPQKIKLSTQNVSGRLQALTNGGVVLRRVDRLNWQVSFALVTPEMREKRDAELRERLRIPADLREEAFVAAGSLGLEVETRVGPPDGPSDGRAWGATATLVVLTRRGEITQQIDVTHEVSDDAIRESWEDLLTEAGLR